MKEDVGKILHHPKVVIPFTPVKAEMNQFPEMTDGP
jgi:hypothetical protein